MRSRLPGFSRCPVGGCRCGTRGLGRNFPHRPRRPREAAAAGRSAGDGALASHAAVPEHHVPRRDLGTGKCHRRRRPKLLLDRNIRTLPVIGADGRLAGAVGPRELTQATETVKGLMSKAGVVVGAERRILGLITQTDLLAAAGRLQTADTGLSAA